MGLFIFVCGLIWLTIRLVFFGIKAAWGITRFVLSVLFLPLVLIALFFYGLKYLAIAIILVLIITDIASNRRTA